MSVTRPFRSKESFEAGTATGGAPPGAAGRLARRNTCTGQPKRISGDKNAVGGFCQRGGNGLPGGPDRGENNARVPGRQAKQLPRPLAADHLFELPTPTGHPACLPLAWGGPALATYWEAIRRGIAACDPGGSAHLPSGPRPAPFTCSCNRCVRSKHPTAREAPPNRTPEDRCASANSRRRFGAEQLREHGPGVASDLTQAESFYLAAARKGNLKAEGACISLLLRGQHGLWRRIKACLTLPALFVKALWVARDERSSRLM